jgi:hypothetical protein
VPAAIFPRCFSPAAGTHVSLLDPSFTPPSPAAFPAPMFSHSGRASWPVSCFHRRCLALFGFSQPVSHSAWKLRTRCQGLVAQGLARVSSVGRPDLRAPALISSPRGSAVPPPAVVFVSLPLFFLIPRQTCFCWSRAAHSPAESPGCRLPPGRWSPLAAGARDFPLARRRYFHCRPDRQVMLSIPLLAVFSVQC